MKLYFGSKTTLVTTLLLLGLLSFIGYFIGCRSCEKVCPQQIKISEAMKDLVASI